MDFYTALGITTANIAIWLGFAIKSWVARRRWRFTVESEEMQKIVAERDALLAERPALELRAASAEAVARQCRLHMARAEDERDQLARRIAGLDDDKEER